MSVGLYSHTTRGTGTVLTASIYNGDHINHITNQNPVMSGAYSDSVGQFQSIVDPGGVGSEILAPNLAGEIERLRFSIKRITGQSQWYAVHTANLANTLNGVNPGLIAIAAALGIPLTLRITDNDVTERTIQAFESGSGAGTDFLLKIKGDAANGIDSMALFKGATELLRLPETRFRWEPMGYLTPTAGIPIIVADASGATSVLYEPFKGNVTAVVKGGIVHMREFSALTLDLNNPNHAANTLYDVFLDDDAGTLKLSTGTAWSNSGAGTSARGAGGSTTELTRLQGWWVNANSMTVRNGAATRTLAAQAGIYLGTILIDAVGTVTCHRSIGQTRKWGVWNAYQRQNLYLKVTDPDDTWNYTTNAIRQSGGDSANTMIIFSGLAEEIHDIEFRQRIDSSANAASIAEGNVGIGINSVAAISGTRGVLRCRNDDIDHVTVAARHILVPTLGRTDINCLEISPQTGGNVNYRGQEQHMILSTKWRG